MSKKDSHTYHLVFELNLNLREKVLLTLALFVIALLSTSILVSLAQARQPLSSELSSVVASPVISYQGQITVKDKNFSGNGEFKFAIVNNYGTTSYWSNDGTGLDSAPFEPVSSVSIYVDKGLFNVLLGDTSLLNMTQPLTSELFSEYDRFLRIWFSDGVNGFQQLSPDVRLASVPYAFNAEFAKTSPNLKRIAMLRWYDEVTTTGNDFDVGLTPVQIAFDGANMWVANQNDGTISVVRSRDGSLSMELDVGTSPFGIAFDGSRMWVTNRSSSNISVLNAKDGSLVKMIPVDPLPQSIVFDGENMWVSHGGSNKLTVFRANDETKIMNPTTGEVVGSLAFDGTNMWVTNFDNGFGNTVGVLRTVDGKQVMTTTVGTGPHYIAFDGSNMWVTNFGDGSSDTVSVLSVADGTNLATVPVNTGAWAIAFDGANMWVTNVYSHTVSKR